MAYQLEAEKVDLGDLQKRIEATDLIPSRISLLDEIGIKMKALEQQGLPVIVFSKTPRLLL